MKTHEAAKLLSQLASTLRACPNIEMEDLAKISSDNNKAQKLSPADNTQVAVNLLTLAELSKIDKSKWASLIEENGIPIKIRPRDASSNVIQKLIAYLNAHPESREKLRDNTRKASAASSELLKAFGSLLK